MFRDCSRSIDPFFSKFSEIQLSHFRILGGFGGAKNKNVRGWFKRHHVPPFFSHCWSIVNKYICLWRYKTSSISRIFYLKKYEAWRISVNTSKFKHDATWTFEWTWKWKQNKQLVCFLTPVCGTLFRVPKSTVESQIGHDQKLIFLPLEPQQVW